MTPTRAQTVNEWADENVNLPPDSAEPGRYRSSRTPYVIPFGDAISSGHYKRCISVMFAQGGKSKTMENAVGWKLDTEPEPILYIGPTKTLLTKVVEPKIDDMIRRCKSLSKKTIFGQAYTKTRKLIAGTSFRFAWAGSTTEIKADTASMVLVDEVDEITIETKGQGSIIPLADARHGTYSNGITIAVSTCTMGTVVPKLNEETNLEHWVKSKKVSSPIWRLWQDGTRHEWAWPCPHCNVYFIPRFKLLRWPKSATPANVHKTAFLACPNNGCEIENESKEWMNERGRAVSPGQKIHKNGRVVGRELESTDYSIWTSGLANPFKPFGRIASNWLRAVRTADDAAIAGVLNTDFGELYSTGGEAPTEDAVRLCCIDYRLGDVNPKVRVITCGVDVQKNRLVYVIRGWCFGWESALIQRGEIWGETDQDQVWNDLELLLETEFESHSMTLMIVDSGYNSQMVYEFARRNKKRVRAAKGQDKISKPFYASKIDVSPRKGKVIKNGLQLWHFCTDTMKTWVHSRVNRDKELPGQWYLPSDIDEDYCKQIIAEERIEKASGGVIWKQVAKDNHYLDAEGMAYLAAMMLSSRITTKDKPKNTPVAQAKNSAESRIRKSRRSNRRRGTKPSWRRQ